MRYIVDKLTSLVMGAYNLFHYDLRSDISLSIVLCARVLAGIKNDEAAYQSLLNRLDFELWSNCKVE